MKNSFYLITALLILIGCTREEPEPEVTFTLNVSGFNITSDDFGTLKSTQTGIFDSFEHKYEGATINFTAPSGAVYEFNTSSSSLDGYSITLSPGTYQISGESVALQPIPKPSMSFTIPEQYIEITQSTTSINLNITPTCGLMLISDQYAQVKESYFIRDGNATKYQFITERSLLYGYFAPWGTYYAHIIKNDDSHLTMETILLKVGYIYRIEVTNAGGGMPFNLNPTFIDGETILW